MTNYKDETGNRYGLLTVLRRADHKEHEKVAHWVCLCDCGNVTEARGSSLRSGGKRSCGCLRSENGKSLSSCEHHRPYDMVGERYGSLLVIRRGGTSRNGSKWVCQCDCGNIVEIKGMSLRNGNTKSCGCSKKAKKVS